MTDSTMARLNDVVKSKYDDKRAVARYEKGERVDRGSSHGFLRACAPLRVPNS